jgi:hypothetical protein
VGTIKVKGNIGTATGKHFFLPFALLRQRCLDLRESAVGLNVGSVHIAGRVGR